MGPGTDNRRLAVIEEAKKWLGTPFRHQASVLGAGVGCGTLLIAVYGALDISVPSISDFDNFPIDWHHHASSERYLDILLRFTHRVDTPVTGDIAVFHMGRAYGHSAIIVEWPIVIHSYWGRSVEYTDATQPPVTRNKRYSPIFLSPF